MKTILSLFLLFSSPFLFLSAEVTDLAIFRMGEDDGGAQAKDPAPETRESLGERYIPSSDPRNPPLYSSDVPELTRLKRGESKFSIAFDGSKRQAFVIEEAIPSGADNFGFECWAKWKGPEKKIGDEKGRSYFHILFCNGNQADGFEIAINTDDPYWNFHYGGVSSGFKVSKENPIPEKNVWTHLALICEEGLTTLFINGVPVNQQRVKPFEPSERFILGALNIGGYTFNGLIDEVRFFKILPGKFSPETDLNFSK